MKASGYGNWQEKRNIRVSIDFLSGIKYRDNDKSYAYNKQKKAVEWRSGCELFNLMVYV